MRRQIVPEYAAGIAQPIGMLPVRRIEKDARRLLSLRAQNYNPRRDLMGFFRIAVDVEDACGPIRVCVHQNLVHHRVRD